MRMLLRRASSNIIKLSIMTMSKKMHHCDWLDKILGLNACLILWYFSNFTVSSLLDFNKRSVQQNTCDNAVLLGPVMDYVIILYYIVLLKVIWSNYIPTLVEMIVSRCRNNVVITVFKCHQRVIQIQVAKAELKIKC